MKHLKIGKDVFKVKRVGTRKGIQALKVKYKAAGQNVKAVKVAGPTWALVVDQPAPDASQPEAKPKKARTSKKETKNS